MTTIRRPKASVVSCKREVGSHCETPDSPLSLESIMTLPASALPIEALPAFLGVAQSATGKLWRDRLDDRGAALGLAIAQRYRLPEMLARACGSRCRDRCGRGLSRPHHPQIDA